MEDREEVLMRGCELGPETAGLVERGQSHNWAGRNKVWLVVSLLVHVGLHRNGLTGAGRMAGTALPATRLTCSANQQLHAGRLPGHSKSDGTSKKAPKRLLSLFLTTAMLFWTWSCLLPCALRQFGSLPAGPYSTAGAPPLLPR